MEKMFLKLFFIAAIIFATWYLTKYGTTSFALSITEEIIKNMLPK